MNSPDPYAYSPYGRQVPALPDPTPVVRRPRLLVVAPLLMLVAALPFLAFGLLFLVAPVDSIAQEILAAPRMQEAGATLALVVAAMRILGGLVLVGAALYVALGFLAFGGRNGARVAAGVLSVAFALLLLAALVAAGGALDTIVLALVLLVLVVGAVVVLFSPGANAWYAARRRALPD